MSEKLSADEAVENLTGFDEIAIVKHFGTDVMSLKDQPFMFLRALIFVDRRRHGDKDGDAKAYAFGLPAKQVYDYFADQPEDELADEDSEPGKGVSEIGTSPVSRPVSA